jgi:aspartyl-tRNA(Asn)/glutamyl-tRNA(Gln) amidotransferase subunit C
MSVTTKQVEEITHLAALGLDQSALPALTEEIRRILEYISQLDSVGDGTVDELGEDPPGPRQPLRDDRPQRASLAIPVEQFAPVFQDGFFIVPRPRGFDDDRPSTPTTEP